VSITKNSQIQNFNDVSLNAQEVSVTDFVNMVYLLQKTSSKLDN